MKYCGIGNKQQAKRGVGCIINKQNIGVIILCKLIPNPHTLIIVIIIISGVKCILSIIPGHLPNLIQIRSNVSTCVNNIIIINGIKCIRYLNPAYNLCFYHISCKSFQLIRCDWITNIQTNFRFNKILLG